MSWEVLSIQGARWRSMCLLGCVTLTAEGRSGGTVACETFNLFQLVPIRYQICSGSFEVIVRNLDIYTTT